MNGSECIGGGRIMQGISSGEILDKAEKRFAKAMLYLFAASWVAGAGLAFYAYYLFTFTRKAAGE